MKNLELRKEFESETKISAIQKDRSTGMQNYSLDYVHWLEDYIRDKWTYKNGVHLISQERDKQVDVLGYLPEDDSKYNKCNELTCAAMALLNQQWDFTDDPDNHLSEPWINDFPANWDSEKCLKMASKEYKKRLVIAGALIAAEIDRINSTETATPHTSGNAV